MQCFPIFRHFSVGQQGYTDPPPPRPDNTKTHSDPQRVRMSSGERQIGATKSKQPDTEALYPPPPPSTSPRRFSPKWRPHRQLIPGGHHFWTRALP